MNQNKFIFVAGVFLLGLTFLLFPSQVQAGCASGYYCYGTAVVDLYKCKPPTPLKTCPGPEASSTRATVSCDSNCSFQYCSSNDDIVCEYRTFEGFGYCAPTNCNTAGNCCALGGPTPAPPPPPPPGPTPVPSYQCTVQGYKVVMPGNQAIQPASGQTVTLNDPATSVTAEPYFLYYQSAGKSRTVSVSVPAGYTVGYTLCYNNTGCHTNPPVMSNTVTLPDNSFCGSSAGFADLWWHYYPPPVPNCKNLTGPSSLYVGDTGTFTATYENGTATIDQRGLAIYREGQCEPNTSAYWNRVNGGVGVQSFNWVPSSAGTYDVDCRAWDSGVSECRGRCYGISPYYAYQCAGTGGGATTTRKVTVLSPVSAWWQVKDSDLLAFGDLRSSVPTSLYFDLVGDVILGTVGFPGVPVYKNSTNLTSTNVSTKKWLVNTDISSKAFNFNSSYFINAIPSGATVNNISSSSIPGSYFASGGTAYNDYYWYVYDGNNNGGFNLTITSAASLGSRKVILIVKNAGLNIQGSINLTKGSGFFLAVTTGNIVVTPNVGGGASANLEGIYVADDKFFSGTEGAKSDPRLWVRGTVASYGGIVLERDLGSASNSTTPAELFEYAPDLELLFPIELANRLTNWREVAP